MTRIIIFLIPCPSMPKAVIREGVEQEKGEQRVLERGEGLAEIIEVLDD